MAEMESRWFPGQRGVNPRFESGWRLAGEGRWDAEEFGGGVELTGVFLAPTRALELDFRIDARESSCLEFREVTDLQVDGSFELGTTAAGWEVMGTSMLVGEYERDDGRRVYMLELSNALLCFASFPGVFLDR